MTEEELELTQVRGQYFVIEKKSVLVTSSRSVFVPCRVPTNCISEVLWELTSKPSDLGGEEISWITLHQAGFGSEDWPRILTTVFWMCWLLLNSGYEFKWTVDIASFWVFRVEFHLFNYVVLSTQRVAGDQLFEDSFERKIQPLPRPPHCPILLSGKVCESFMAINDHWTINLCPEGTFCMPTTNDKVRI